jgi:hypothetical protein
LATFDVSHVLDQSPEIIVLVSWDQDEEPELFVDKLLYPDDGFDRTCISDHKLEHHHDPERGDYYLLVFHQKVEPLKAGEDQLTVPYAYAIPLYETMCWRDERRVCGPKLQAATPNLPASERGSTA